MRNEKYRNLITGEIWTRAELQDLYMMANKQMEWQEDFTDLLKDLINNGVLEIAEQ